MISLWDVKIKVQKLGFGGFEFVGFGSFGSFSIAFD